MAHFMYWLAALLQNYINLTQTQAEIFVFVQKYKIAAATILNFIFICPIAIAYHGTDYKITYVTLSFCQSACKHSYGCNFDSILMKFCTVIWDPKSKIEFVWDKNLIKSSFILPPF